MKTILIRCTVAAAMCLAGTAAFAQGAKSTRIVVAFPPGGPVDFVARALGDQLGKELQQQVIIENKAGANGAIGADAVARSTPDGSTLWLTSVGAAAVNQALYEKLPYDMQRDFAPVALVVNNVEVFVVNPSNPSNTTAEFVAASKKAGNPVPIASSGIGSIPHLAIEQLLDASGANVMHIPYKGAAPAITDVMGNQVAAFFGDVPGLIGHIRSGKLKAIGLAADKRSAVLPQVPTLAEQGIKGVDTNNWYALFAPAKTPPATVEAISQAVRRALATPALHDKLMATGAEPAASTPQELAMLLKHDSDKWAKLIAAKKIKVE